MHIKRYSIDTFISQTPRICPNYQTGTYNITIYYINDNESIVHQFGPIEFTQGQELIVEEVKNGFFLGEHYGINITAQSFGIVRFQATVFGNHDYSQYDNYS